MRFKINDSLATVGQPYADLVEAEAKYTRIKTDLLGPIKEQIKTWKAEDVSPEDVVNKVFDNLGFTLKERYDYKDIPADYNGNQWIIGHFFGHVANGDQFSLQGKKLRIHFQKAITDLIEVAQYQGLRSKESQFFEHFCATLGVDFKAAYLFSASDPTCFKFDNYSDEHLSENHRRLGHWDYMDAAYFPRTGTDRRNSLDDRTLGQLREVRVTNPELIPEDGIFTAPPFVDRWKNITRGSKSVTLAPWAIGHEKPTTIEYHSYDLTYADSDQTSDRHLGTPEMVKLTKLGGYIVVPDYLATHILRSHKGQVIPLLRNPEGDYSLLQKVS